MKSKIRKLGPEMNPHNLPVEVFTYANGEIRERVIYPDLSEKYEVTASNGEIVKFDISRIDSVNYRIIGKIGNRHITAQRFVLWYKVPEMKKKAVELIEGLVERHGEL